MLAELDRMFIEVTAIGGLNPDDTPAEAITLLSVHSIEGWQPAADGDTRVFMSSRYVHLIKESPAELERLIANAYRAYGTEPKVSSPTTQAVVAAVPLPVFDPEDPKFDVPTQTVSPATSLAILGDWQADLRVTLVDFHTWSIKMLDNYVEDRHMLRNARNLFNANFDRLLTSLRLDPLTPAAGGSSLSPQVQQLVDQARQSAHDSSVQNPFVALSAGSEEASRAAG